MQQTNTDAPYALRAPCMCEGAQVLKLKVWVFGWARLAFVTAVTMLRVSLPCVVLGSCELSVLAHELWLLDSCLQL